MKRSGIYLKYKQERENARLLIKSKKPKLSRENPEPTIKKNNEVPQNLRVSLPINHFIKAQNKRNTLTNKSVLEENRNDAGELQVPKLIIKMKRTAESKQITKSLRQIRRTSRKISTIEQNKKADESSKTIPKKPILRDLSVVLTREFIDTSKNLKNSSEGGTNKGVDKTTQCSESPVCIQHKVIPIKIPDGTESYRTCYAIDETLSNTEASKDNPREPMYVVTRTEFEKYMKFRENGVLQRLEELEKQILKNSKQLTQVPPAEGEIIDLDTYIDTDDKLNQERLNLALSHSKANKTILKALRNQMTNSTSDGITEVTRPTRAGTPFSFVNPNIANAPARVNTPTNVVVSTSNATPCYIRSSAATTLSNSQSMTPSLIRLAHNNQQPKDIVISRQTSNGHNEIRNEVMNITQDNNRPSEVNLNTLADTANSLNKLTLPTVVAALRKDYQLRQNQLAQRQREKARELQSHKYIMHPTQLLPPKPKPPTLPAQLQPPQLEPDLSAQLPKMQPRVSQLAHQQPPKMQQIQQPQPQHVQPHNPQSTQPQFSMSQPSSLQQLQRLQPQPTQTQLQPDYSKPTQLQQSTKSQPRQPNPPQTQLPQQQPPPLPPPQLQPLQMQFLHPPPYPQQQPQIPHSQWPSINGAQQWQQIFYGTQQQQYPQQNGQYIQRQHNYPNVYGTQNQQTKKAKRGDIHLHPGDPRKPPQSWSNARAISSYARMPYEDNHQNVENAPQPNYYPLQMHWNNPNHYW